MGWIARVIVVARASLHIIGDRYATVQVCARLSNALTPAESIATADFQSNSKVMMPATTFVQGDVDDVAALRKMMTKQ